MKGDYLTVQICLSFLLQSDLPILYFLIMSRATFKVWSFVMCLMHHLLDRQRLEISHKARLSKAQCSLIFGFCPCVCFFFFFGTDIITVHALLSIKLPFDCLQNEEWDIYIQGSREQYY